MADTSAKPAIPTLLFFCFLHDLRFVRICNDFRAIGLSCSEDPSAFFMISVPLGKSTEDLSAVVHEDTWAPGERCPFSHMDITDFLIETADQCARIAKTGRMLVEQLDTVVGTRTPLPLSQLSDGGRGLSEQVERVAQSLLAKAVEVDHERQKKRTPSA